MKTDDNALARRAAAGDAAAFEVLLERHYDRIFRLAWRFVRDRTDAEDIAQDICLLLAKKISSFKGSAQFSTWLYKVVLNQCRDDRRKQTTRSQKQSEYAEAEALALEVERENRAQRHSLLEMLDEIGGVLKETAILVVCEGLNHQEAAGILGVKESTISWRMHELKKKLTEMADQS